jgi:putative ATP-binding cassette transporter
MKRIFKFISLFLCLICISASAYEPNQELGRIDEIVKSSMDSGKIPGLALVVIKDNKILLNKGYGFANLESKLPVTAETLFELGSNTKAFTALAILNLSEEKKLNLEAPIGKYLPWFSSYYNGEPAFITIKDLLYHLSGIPASTLSSLQPSSKDTALLETVQNINAISLDTLPGTKFQYATINYDILGLLIQELTGKPYEQYLKETILKPLSLSNSLLNRELAYKSPNMSVGYKIEFLKARPYQAPTYRGNTPAGYLISNSKDIGKWLLNQLSPKQFEKLIAISHSTNPTTQNAVQNSKYAAGWFNIQSDMGSVFSHPGNNPNFSSYIAFIPEKQLGVAVLSNVNSNYSMDIGIAVLHTLLGSHSVINGDPLLNLDFYSVIVIGLGLPLFFWLSYCIVKLALSILNKERRIASFLKLLMVIPSILFISLLGYLLYATPSALGANWSFIRVWGPWSLITAVFLVFSILVLSIFYIQMLLLFPRSRKLKDLPMKQTRRTT